MRWRPVRVTHAARQRLPLATSARRRSKPSLLRHRLSPRVVFYALLAAVLAVGALICSFAPTVGDDWLAREWRESGHGFADLGAKISFNYRIYNPRLGEAFLYLTAGWRAIHIVLTPVVILATVVALLVLALGRWPRPREWRDSGYLVLLIALACVGMASLGENVFYRPFASNYLYGFCLQAWLLVPPRVQSQRTAWWTVPGMAVLGFAAGMCNEHTGPTLCVAYAGLAFLAVRASRRSAPWLAAGLLGVVAGFLALFFAPGLRVRAGGLGKVPILLRIYRRGVPGALQPFVGLVHEAWPSLVLLALVLAYAWYCRRRGRPLATPWATVAALAAAALTITLTLIASPFQGGRLALAPCLLLAAAALAALVPLLGSRRAFLAFVGVAALVVGYHALRLVQVQAQLGADYANRYAILQTPRPRFLAVPVPPTKYFHQPHWVVTDELAQDGWRRALAARYQARTLVLDTTRLDVLLLSGLSTDWMADGRFVNHLAPGQPAPPAGPMRADFFASARDHADEWGPRLARLLEGKITVLCLRALLPPGLTDGRRLCLARWVKGVPSPRLAAAKDGTWRVPAAAWPYATSYVTTLDGRRTPLTSTAEGDELVLHGEVAGGGIRLLIGCSGEAGGDCVVGALLD
jgi:hypothetical protein